VSERIHWSDEPEASMTACFGYAGTVGPHLFQIHKPLPGGGPEWSEWILTCRLPGMEGKRHYGDSAEELKPAAERWLTEFTASLGASFPENPAVTQDDEMAATMARED
jgi:hypothetical protein